MHRHTHTLIIPDGYFSPGGHPSPDSVADVGTQMTLSGPSRRSGIPSRHLGRKSPWVIVARKPEPKKTHTHTHTQTQALLVCSLICTCNSPLLSCDSQVQGADGLAGLGECFVVKQTNSKASETLNASASVFLCLFHFLPLCMCCSYNSRHSRGRLYGKLTIPLLRMLPKVPLI